MDLNRDSYYSKEADWEYMSCSQYQNFCQCEAKAMAVIQGRWEEPPGEAFLVGNYFHTYFESPEAHRQFVGENADSIFLKQTKKEAENGILRLRAPFVHADAMIKCATDDPLISNIINMPGENEKILTGELFGVPWRIRMDKYVPDGRLIVDYKTVANIWETRWSEELHARVSFIETYGYLFRAAVYSEIEKQNVKSQSDPQFLIIAISKQDPPDKEVLLLNHRQRYDYELERIKETLPYIQRVKQGLIRPRRCGVCDYCRATKTLEVIKPYYVLMPEFREGLEEDQNAGSLLDIPSEEAPVDGMSTMPGSSSMDSSGRQYVESL